MNKIYRSIWNELTGTFVAVAEIATARGKRVGSQVAGAFGTLFGLTPLAAGLMAAGLAQAAPPVPSQLPTGGNVVAGQAHIGQTNAVMNVTQTSSRAVVDWGSFNVGSSATVNFVQPSSSSAILNRVQDANPSQILGRINANGQVFFTNPSGIYFGQSATINVGALTATTHSIGNADFMAGNLSFSRNGATGSVVNDGTINAALGGYIALLAPEVHNNGVVVAQMGTVALAAGEVYELQFDGSRLANVRVEPATIAALVENKQAVQAPGGLIILSAQAANHLQGGVVNNSGSLEATGLVDNGGTIRLSASDKISHSGSIKADAAANSSGSGGSVSLIADLANASSVTDVNGSISARGGDRGGNGGFVETSAGKVRVGDSASIDTQAPVGKVGTWLIDPDGFTIAATGGDITGATLSANLTRGDVVIASTTGTGSDGNVNVNDNVWWNANKLSLTATNDVNVNAVMTMTGTSQLDVTTGASGKLNMGFDTGGGFKGRIDLPGRSGTFVSGTTPILSVNGDNYTIINSLGAAVDATSGSNQTLQGMARTSNLSGKFALGSDIDASTTSSWNTGKGFAPIGETSSPTRYFSGAFDGLGHTINNLTINRPNQGAVGLFGYGSGASTIRNVGVTNANVVGQLQVGALAGYTYGLVHNSYATGAVSGSALSSVLGGLIGKLSGDYGNGAVGVLDSSHANVIVTGGMANPNSDAMGGLVGQLQRGTVTNAYANGAVVSNGYFAGGLIGRVTNTSTVRNVYASGAVSATGFDGIGGLIGIVDATSAALSNATDGGGTITNAYATGKVTGSRYSGGLIGRVSVTDPYTVSNAFATGNVTSDSPVVGGLIGGSSGTHLQNVFATGNVVSNGAYIGGLVGMASGDITDAYATGNVDAGSGRNVGGLVGGINGGAQITRAYAKGNVVTQSAYAGGLVGTVGYGGGTITNAYATGSVTAGSYAGGLVGIVWNGNGSSSFTITSSTAYGAITGNARTGGLIGSVYQGTTNVVDSYWNSDTTGMSSSSGGGAAKTSTELLDHTLYGTWDAAAWNIDATDGRAPNLQRTNTLSTSGSWSTDANWSLGHAPTALETAALGNKTVTVSGNVMAADVTATAGAKLSFTGPLVSSLTVGQSGPVTLGTSANDVAIDYGTSGKLNLPAASQLSYNGSSYTVINSVGAATDKNASGNNTLQGLAYSTMLSGRYVLGMDIDASDTATWNSNTGFTPIGINSYQPNSAFAGTLDGLGHSVVNMAINRPAAANVQAQLDAASYQGLFGYISDGSLKNLGTVGAKVTGYYYVGALAGDVEVTGAASFANLWSVDSQVKGADNVGGVFGAASAAWGGSLAFNKVHVSGTVTGTSDIADPSYSYARLRAGGMVGYAVLGGSANSPGSITDSYSQADVATDTGVTATANGGVLGTGINASLTNVYSTGRVSGADNVGGVVGYGIGMSSHYAFANGAVTGSAASVGGLIGSLSQGSIWYSRASGAVAGTSQVGGLIGNMDSAWGPHYVSLLVSPVATGNVTGTGNDLGGLIGHAGGYPGSSYAGPAYQQINAAQSFGNVTGSTSASDHVGGLVGYGKYASITGDINKVSVSGATVVGHDQVGGLIGKNFEGNISYSKLINVAISGNNEVGGLAGYNDNGDASGNLGSITYSTVSGTNASSTVAFTSTVTGQNYVGGLVGRDEHGSQTGNTVGTLDSSVVVPNVLVSGMNYVGGLAGSTHASDVGSGGLLQAQAEVHGANYTGGAIGIDTDSTLMGTSLTNAKVVAVGDATSHEVYAVGGLIGKATNTTIQGAILQAGAVNAQDATATAVRAVGGMVGDATGVSFTNNQGDGNSVSLNLQIGASTNWTGTVDGLGGVVGKMTGGSIHQARSSGVIALQGTGTKSNIGGVAGVADGVALTEVSANRTITAAGGSNLGGLVGKLTNGASITNAYSEGSINPGSSGATNVGGLVGLMDGTGVQVTVDKTYSITTIASANASTMGSLVGGLAGGTSTAQMTNSFYNNALNAGLTGVGGGAADATTHVVGKTTADLQNINTFLAAGWDVVAVGNSTNYPILGYTTHDTHKWTMAGPQTTTIYLLLQSGSSIYGDTPTLSYKLYTTATGGTEVTDASASGSVVWSTPLTATSNANTYGESYSSGLTLGNSAYSLSAGNASNWVINPRPLNVAVTKVYDGTTSYDYTASYVFTGMVNSNAAPTASSGAATVASKNVGNYTAFANNTLTLSDANYTLLGGTVSADITAKPLTVSGTTVASKTYDGTVTAALSGGTLQGVVSNESVTLTQAGSFADKNAGAGKTVTATDILGGADASNYMLTQPTGLSAAITAKPIQIAGLTARDKLYDGTVAVTVTDWGAPVGLVGIETLLLSHGTASYEDASVGGAKKVLATGYSVADGSNGGLASNYVLLSNTASTTASIQAAPATSPVTPPVAPPVPALALPVQGQALQMAADSTPTPGSTASGLAAPAVASVPQSSAGSDTGRFSGITVSMQPSTHVQQAPVVTVAVPKELATSGTGFSFPLPEQVAHVVQGAAPLRVELLDGSPLPSWLMFNPESKVFTGTAVPEGSFPLQLVVINGTERTTVVISEKAQ